MVVFEITRRCNPCCKHCGSGCTSIGQSLSVQDVESTLASVQSDHPMICLTDGEPLMHPDFYEIFKRIRSMWFSWGMTTNATLIDEETAFQPRQAKCPRFLSVWTDWNIHMICSEGKQMLGIVQSAGYNPLQKAGFEPQVTTVLHKGNIREFEPLYTLLCDMGIDSWRPINIEPIGRACEAGNLLLSMEKSGHLLRFIRKKPWIPKNIKKAAPLLTIPIGVDSNRALILKE